MRFAGRAGRSRPSGAISVWVFRPAVDEKSTASASSRSSTHVDDAIVGIAVTEVAPPHGHALGELGDRPLAAQAPGQRIPDAGVVRVVGLEERDAAGDLVAVERQIAAGPHMPFVTTSPSSPSRCASSSRSQRRQPSRASCASAHSRSSRWAIRKIPPGALRLSGPGLLGLQDEHVLTPLAHSSYAVASPQIAAPTMITIARIVGFSPVADPPGHRRRPRGRAAAADLGRGPPLAPARPHRAARRDRSGPPQLDPDARDRAGRGRLAGGARAAAGARARRPAGERRRSG